MNNALQQVIQEGIRLLREKGLNDAMFLIWLNYSHNMLSLITGNGVLVYQYSRVIANIPSNQPPFEKLSTCIQFLIQISGIVR